MDRAMEKAEEIGLDTQNEILTGYEKSISTLLEKHRPTLERIEALKESGKPALARALLRSSGLMDGIARAIAGAGALAANAIQRQREKIGGVMADDDGETP